MLHRDKADFDPLYFVFFHGDADVGFMTKTCIYCHETKPLSEFHKSPTNKYGVDCRCRDCANSRARERYKNPETKAKIRIRRRKALDWYREYKESLPCIDCGKYFPHFVMDFDHVGEDKIDGVGRLVQSVSIERVKVEIDKCELVCANCHRYRTWTRLNEY